MTAALVLGTGNLPTVHDMVERVPRTWALRPDVPLPRGAVCWEWAHMTRTIRVIVSVDDAGIEGVWLHSSASAQRKGRVELPSWAELAHVKQVVHGDRYAIQILPPRREYVNLTEALHLWERLDQPTIPDAIGRKSR